MRATLLGLVLALGGFAGTAQAQDAAGDRTATATATATGPKAISTKQARRFVRQISSAAGDQLARFADPVCPLVIGMPDDMVRTIEQRIRDIAAEAGARIGAGGCRANLVAIVAADPETLTGGLRKHYPALFQGLSSAELRRTMREGPVRVWNMVEVRSEEGQGLDGGDPEAAPVLKVRTSSRLTLSAQTVTVQSMVVLDASAVVGKTLDQLAGYVAMRTLAGARATGGTGVADTILSLFDAGATPPPALTAIDRDVLEELYAMRPNMRAAWQKGRISRRIAQESRERTRED